MTVTKDELLEALHKQRGWQAGHGWDGWNYILSSVADGISYWGQHIDLNQRFMECCIQYAHEHGWKAVLRIIIDVMPDNYGIKRKVPKKKCGTTVEVGDGKWYNCDLALNHQGPHKSRPYFHSSEVLKERTP